MHVIAYFESLDLTMYSNKTQPMNILLLSSFIFFTSASNFLEEWWMIISHLKPAITWLMPSYITKMLELLGFVYFSLSDPSRINSTFCVLHLDSATTKAFWRIKFILKFPLFMVKHFEPLKWNPCLWCHCNPLYIFVMWIYSNHVALTRGCSTFWN